tara:strand:+ start:120 stop:497 length:378 start_codon:yes stop_codon:yes gene_type:complete
LPDDNFSGRPSFRVWIGVPHAKVFRAFVRAGEGAGKIIAKNCLCGLTAPPLSNTKQPSCGGVAQLVRASACHAEGRGFEPRHSRHFPEKYKEAKHADRILPGLVAAGFCISNYGGILLPIRFSSL